MQTVERVIRLRQGPPWGFRLMDSYDGNLVVSQVICAHLALLVRVNLIDLSKLIKMRLILAIVTVDKIRWHNKNSIGNRIT